MKAFIVWLYSTFPGLTDFLPPLLLYLGLWAVVLLVVAVVSWYVWFLVASVLVRIFNRVVDLFFDSLELLSRLAFGKRAVIVEDRRRGEPEA